MYFRQVAFKHENSPAGMTHLCGQLVAPVRERVQIGLDNSPFGCLASRCAEFLSPRQFLLRTTLRHELRDSRHHPVFLLATSALTSSKAFRSFCTFGSTLVVALAFSLFTHKSRYSASKLGLAESTSFPTAGNILGGLLVLWDCEPRNGVVVVVEEVDWKKAEASHD